MAGATPAFSRPLMWQISHAALEALLEPTVDFAIDVAALYALLRDFQRFGSSLQPRCELHAASRRSHSA